MKYSFPLFSVFALLLIGTWCQVFISDTRLRGPVPSPEELAEQEVAMLHATETAAAPASAEENDIQAIIDDLTSRIGEDLAAQNTFSGRETPRAGPLRGMRLEVGDIIRISSGRSQETAVEADEYCVDQGNRCSTVWIYGRPGGGSLGAWYPIVIFDYDLDK